MPETGDYESDGEPDEEALERHYRVTLDFRVLARAIMPEVCRETFFFNDEAAAARGADFREQVERQRRLYDKLRKNRPALEQYLLSLITRDAVRIASGGLADAFGVEDEDEFLIPLYRGMEEDDARFFEECREAGALAENTELLGAAFKVEWIDAEVAEMSRRVAGDVKRAEAVAHTKTLLIKGFSSVPRQSEGGIKARNIRGRTDDKDKKSDIE